MHNSERDSKSSEGGLFQLPSLPPWRTPRIQDERGQAQSQLQTYNQQHKNNYTTPLRKASPLLLFHSHQVQYIRDEQDIPDDDLDYENKQATAPQDNIEYNYSPLSDKLLLQQSKIGDFLHSERAAHCLVFHKCGHAKGIDEYRPDLDTGCGELEESGSDDESDSGNLLLYVPGCTKQDMNLLLNKDYISQRPNVRRIDEILNHEANALKRFWNGSDLTKVLERSNLHEQYLILKQEQKELAQVKATLQPDKAKSLKDKWSQLHSNI